jgi:hypothetical protein
VLAPFESLWPAAGAPSADASAAMAGWWSSLLAQTPSVDIVALQDGVGVHAGDAEPRSPLSASRLIAAVAKAAALQGKQMWTDIEVFSHPNYTVAPSERVLEQIALEAPFVSGMTIWEFTAYMDPRNCSLNAAHSAACAQLYSDYRAYLLA